MDGALTHKRVEIPRLFESEIALVIRDNGEHIAKELAGITSILEYDLKSRPPQEIHDIYYDTKQGSLRNKQINLRVRKIDNALLLSTKSNPRRIGKGTRREEMELPWSPQSLVQMTQDLKLRMPRVGISQFFATTPSKIFATIGLYMIQERITKRETREINSRAKPQSSPLAELAIDEVTFLLEESKVRFFEVEIEAKAAGFFPRVQEIADALVSFYPGFVEEWIHGKFVTGLAIRRLLKTGGLRAYLDHDRLRPEAFHLIDQSIRLGRF